MCIIKTFSGIQVLENFPPKHPSSGNYYAPENNEDENKEIRDSTKRCSNQKKQVNYQDDVGKKVLDQLWSRPASIWSQLEHSPRLVCK